jgi:protein SCO1/2
VKRHAGGFLAGLLLVAGFAPAPCADAQPVSEAPRRAEAARLMNELMTGQGPIGTAFALPDQHGRRVGPAQWRGRVVLLYFGYTFCPDVCPTDLRSIGDAIEALGAEGARVQPVFITLDPQRDVPAVIGAYAESFHPRFTALSGTEDEVRRVARAYKVFYEKVPLAGGSGYVIDHTSFIYVLDVEGRYAGYFPPGTSGRRMAEFLRSMHAPAAAAAAGASR